MKKNRPGIKVNILCSEEDATIFEDLLFNETTTLGIRKIKIDRVKLDRSYITIRSKYGNITIKAALKDGNVFKYSPEYEECKEIALKYDMPIKDVYNEIMFIANEHFNN